MVTMPRVFLWAWERPEDLRFIDPAEVGVAFLAETVYLRPVREGGSESVQVRIESRPRLQPLAVPAGTALIAVARVEVAQSIGAGAIPFSRETVDGVAARIAAVGRIPGVRAVQVDFDATTSGRAFYRDLLVELRRRLPDGVPLSITALASWCIGDNWLAGLPVDEAVPMLFRMGVDERNVRLYLDSGGDFRAPACRQSLGISTDERPPRLPPLRRVYIFHPRAWDSRAVTKILDEVRP